MRAPRHAHHAQHGKFQIPHSRQPTHTPSQLPTALTLSTNVMIVKKKTTHSQKKNGSLIRAHSLSLSYPHGYFVRLRARVHRTLQTRHVPRNSDDIIM